MAAGRHGPRGLSSAAGREAAAALLLLEDLRIATLLLNAARYRALERWLGLNRTQANLLTVVALATVADAGQRQTARLVAPGAPGAADFALGAAAAESALLSLAGRAALGAAPGSLLLTIAVLYKLLGVPSRRALRGVTQSPFRLRRAVMAQAQRMADAAVAAAASARDAASAASPPTDEHTTPAATT
jgi:hypothetical protein